MSFSRPDAKTQRGRLNRVAAVDAASQESAVYPVTFLESLAGVLSGAAFDVMPGAAAVIDDDGVIRHVNRAWRDLTRARAGRTSSVLPQVLYVGQNYFSVLSTLTKPVDELATSIAHGLSAVLTGHAAEFFSPGYQNAAATAIGGAVSGAATISETFDWPSLSIRPLLFQPIDGAVTRWALLTYASATDMAVPAQELAATASSARGWSIDNPVFLQAILDDIADMVVTTDAVGRIQSFNRAAEAAFDHPASAVLGEDVAMLMAEPGGLGPMQQMLGQSRQVKARRRDGEVFWVDLRISACWVDGHCFFVSTMRDTTQRRQMEADLRQAKQAAEQSNRAKSDFLARMSHELRTPLNSILGFAEVIKDQLFGNEPPRYAGYAQNIYDSGTWLLGLINDILDLSKIEAGRLDLKITRHDPVPLIHAALDIVSAQLLARELKLVIDLPPTLPAIDIDSRAFQQIMINLLSNAIKFTPRGGEIRISSRHVPAARGFEGDPRGEELQVMVSDTGIGISSEKIARVLDPFGHSQGGLLTDAEDIRLDDVEQGDDMPAHRMSGRGRMQKGSGLGLSICKRLMELQQGDLTLASQPGLGTTAILHFVISP